MKNKNLFIVLAVVLVLLIAGIVTWLVMRDSDSNDASDSGSGSIIDRVSDSIGSDEEPTIKHLGIELEKYDPATKTAGDIVFTDIKLEQERLVFDYGYQIEANSAAPARKNPQPTFIVPLGTKVHAIVDGEVVDVPKLYSNDYSIHVQAKGSDLIFEMEHVMNVSVQKGDMVQAGDVVAEVSDYDTRNMPGFGLLEIGVLEGGNPPKHLCPFEFLDPSIKEETFANLESIYAGWNEYKGKTIYDSSTYAMPGCISTEKVEG